MARNFTSRDWRSLGFGVRRGLGGLLGGESTTRRPRRRNQRPPMLEVLEARELLAAPNPFDLASLSGTNGFRLDRIYRWQHRILRGRGRERCCSSPVRLD